MWNNYCHIWNPQPQICQFAKFCKKQWRLKLWLKLCYLGIFWPIILKKILSYFPSGPSKNYSHIWNQQPQICQFPKFLEKTMMSKVVAKNALFRHFPGYYIQKLLTYLKSATSNLSNCEIFKELFSYLKSEPWNLSNFQISQENNNV